MKTLLNIIDRVANKIRLLAAVIVEALTGRVCESCKHFAKGSCWHPDVETRDDCETSIFPVGYEPMEEADRNAK